MTAEKITVVTADYEEFKPETFRGYVVNEVVFQELDDAIQYGCTFADTVYLSSTVENYHHDLKTFK